MTEPSVHVVTDLPEKKNFNLKSILVKTSLALAAVGIVAAIARSEKFASKDTGNSNDSSLETIGSPTK